MELYLVKRSSTIPDKSHPCYWSKVPTENFSCDISNTWWSTTLDDNVIKLPHLILKIKWYFYRRKATQFPTMTYKYEFVNEKSALLGQVLDG